MDRHPPSLLSFTKTIKVRSGECPSVSTHCFLISLLSLSSVPGKKKFQRERDISRTRHECELFTQTGLQSWIFQQSYTSNTLIFLFLLPPKKVVTSSIGIHSLVLFLVGKKIQDRRGVQTVDESNKMFIPRG